MPDRTNVGQTTFDSLASAAYMASDQNVALDPTDWRILAELQEDARLSHAELARRVHLSPPAVAARIRRLEDAGVILGYRLDLGLPALGLAVLAFIRVRSRPAGRPAFDRAIQTMPEVLECHHVTGEDCYVVKVATRSMPHLEDVVSELGRHGETTTSIVFSSAVANRTVTRTETEGPSSSLAMLDERPGTAVPHQ
jgi:Lrp/AsnC family transcriptional regulator, leucine-responsive regulatory protein